MSWKHSKVPVFKTSTILGCVSELWKLLWNQSAQLQRSFQKSWASLFSSTFTIVKGMEDGNTQQYFNILPPRTKNQIKLILNFSTKKKKWNAAPTPPQNITGKPVFSRFFFKLSLMYKVVLQCWVLNAGKSLSTCSRNISQFNNLIQYLMSANFESPLRRIRETFVPQW